MPQLSKESRPECGPPSPPHARGTRKYSWNASRSVIKCYMMAYCLKFDGIMLLALNCQRQDLHFHEKLIFIFLFTSAWTRLWSWSCSWRPRSPAQWRCSGPRTARKRSTWRWTDTRTHWVGDKLINVESYKIVIVLLYIHIPVISELVETTEGPLVQVE